MLFRGKKWFSLNLATKFTTLAPEVVAPVPATKVSDLQPRYRSCSSTKFSTKFSTNLVRCDDGPTKEGSFQKLSCGTVRNLVHFLLVVETIVLNLVLNLVPRYQN